MTEKCLWCGETYDEHLDSREKNDPVPKVPCLLLKSGFTKNLIKDDVLITRSDNWGSVELHRLFCGHLPAEDCCLAEKLVNEYWDKYTTEDSETGLPNYTQHPATLANWVGKKLFYYQYRIEELTKALEKLTSQQ